MKSVIAATLCTAMFASSAVVARAKPGFQPRPCGSEAAAAGARCGVVVVPENHAQPRGRTIGLNVVVLPALKPADGTRIAQFDLEGGPGFAATDFLSFYAGDGALYRQRRDIVLADMRGTGTSNALRCPALEELQARDPWAPVYPPDLVAECARQLSQTNDLAAYSTAAAAQDIDLIRRALGYEQFDLNAISYGTTLALRYIADYPRRVHSAALMGTVPAGRTPPRFHAQAAAIALNALAAECRNSADCARHGDVIENFLAVRARLLERPHSKADVFAEKIRNRLYAPAFSRDVPSLLAKAVQGDLVAFSAPSSGGRVFADGLYLSITCGESFARMDVAAAIADSKQTPFGAYRLERQRDACARWPEARADDALMKTPPSGVPVLFIAGARDPVSPSGWARETAAAFRDSRLVEVAYGAHVFDGLTGLDTCLDATIVRFFDLGSTRPLDVACFDHMQPPPFAHD